MLRALMLLLAVLGSAWLQFAFFPGHSYLQSGTQLYLPMLERLNAPGFLSRDLVATHPTLAYSIYDEMTLSLHDATRLDFKSVLIAQQLLFRLCAILGVFFLAKSARLS